MNPNKPIKIAILAMGGEGGGVLADWIVHLAESNGFVAQTTSVPGVAQRTGATIYYVEMFSKRVAEKYQATPVLALMPIPEDVDIVLTSELMEAGRAIQRSLVTPDQTLLITSTHRVYSYQERASMGDGRVDTKSLIAHAKRSSKRLIHFDMEKVAAENKSVISSVLFGALCESGALPFSKEHFEQTIRKGGVGVKASLNAFHAAGLMSATENVLPQVPTHLRNVHPLARTFPKQCQETISNGIARLIDYQDKDYASDYVDTLKKIELEHHPKLLNSVARHLALWLSYEDVMRVADLKVRASRFQRVRQEVGANTEQILHIEEFMHPGLDEICDSLPARLGNWVKHSPILSRLIHRWTHKGRRVRTSSLPGFLMLYLLANWKAHRRITLRHQNEKRAIQTWLKRIKDIARNNPELSLEIALCQRLVKGYGDTHKRGMKNFIQLMSLSDRYIDELSPSLLKELRDAALADEHGEALKKLQARYSLIL